MNTDELSNIGKRMPYTVPDGFFDSLEDRVMSRIAQEEPAAPVRKRRRGIIKAISFGAVAAAAALALVILPDNSTPQVQVQTPTVQYADVEHAFDQLSASDREYLVDNYDDQLLAAYDDQYGAGMYEYYTDSEQ